MQYRREIDGLRAIAVLPVILFHAGFSWFSGGYVGVDVFFVISGYLITSILLSDLDKGTFSIARFYERRARRILPALFLVMLCCIPFAWAWMTPTQFTDFSQGFVAIVFFASNVLFWKKEDYFAQPAEENPLLHTWSLAVEEQFYIVFPILLFMLWRFGQRPIFWVIVALSAFSLILSEWGWRNAPGANFYLLPTRAWELGTGAICALMLYGRAQKTSQWLSATGLLLIVCPVLFYNEETPFPSVFALAPVMGTAFIILFGSKDTLVARLLHTRVLVGIGLISFSAYLWHQPLLAFARIYSFSTPSLYLMGALSALSLVLAYLSWRYIESPFRDKRRTSLTRNRIFAISGVTSLLFLSAGMIGHVTGGLEQRLSPDQRNWTSTIRKLHSERLQSIKANVCHFSPDLGELGINEFIAQWDCTGTPTAGQRRIAVYGDSHSADKAAALRAAAIEPMQMGGSRCPLTPSDSIRTYCDIALEKFLHSARESGVDTVVLANRFTELDLTGAHLQEIMTFWADRFDRVILFTPMPEFPGFDAKYSFWGNDADQMEADLRFHDKFLEAISPLQAPENVDIVDTQKYFCGSTDSNDCKPIQDGTVMLTDYGHLSTRGANLFGQRLIEDIDLVTGSLASHEFQ
ncbi:acyltransferase family protein [Marinobacter lacisalsi]|uniref:Acyltransferase family protein n=1 Tax=Marinobacter lacisalsi TaxID=475979 RepID=A0ABV8QKQ6_9GAMM